MSERNTASIRYVNGLAEPATDRKFYPYEGEMKKSWDEFKERKEFLENVNKRFAPLEEVNESEKKSDQIGSETLEKDAEKDKYVEQLKEEARKLHEEEQKIYAEYKDKGSENYVFKATVANFKARVLEHLDKFEEALNIDRAVKNYEQNSPDNTNTVGGKESRKNESISPFYSFVPGKPQPINIPRKSGHTADSGPVSLHEIEQVLNNGNEPSQNTEPGLSNEPRSNNEPSQNTEPGLNSTEPGISQPSVARDTGNTASENNTGLSTLKANAHSVPQSEGNINESSRTNNGRE